MSKFKTWEKVRKEFNFTKEEEEIRLEKELIRTIIELRKNSKLTQRELSEKSGIIQPSIAKIEKLSRSPQASTLIKLLYPMGYTLKITPINKNKSKTISKPKKNI